LLRDPLMFGFVVIHVFLFFFLFPIFGCRKSFGAARARAVATRVL
jgi:hypothetical protein